MQRLNFSLTPEALDALRRFLQNIHGIEHPIIAPVQDSGDAAKRKWAMGIYDRKNLAVVDPLIVNIGGLEFYIDPSMSAALAGQILSYVDGAFVIT